MVPYPLAADISDRLVKCIEYRYDVKRLLEIKRCSCKTWQLM